MIGADCQWGDTERADFDAAFIEAANLWTNNSTFRFNIGGEIPEPRAKSDMLPGIPDNVGVHLEQRTVEAVEVDGKTNRLSTDRPVG